MAVELINICKSFDEPPRRVLDGVNLTFGEGITCVMGASGIGKTTMVNIVAGIVKPDSGEINGVENKRISMVFQEDRLLEWETALTNVLFAKKDRAMAEKLLQLAGLEDSINKKTSELSGGMKRRVCLCRALIADYDILILDEPFKGLDSGTKPQVMQMVKDFAHGVVIVITHDVSEAEYLGGERLEM